jgi:hypothetical protein
MLDIDGAGKIQSMPIYNGFTIYGGDIATPSSNNYGLNIPRDGVEANLNAVVGGETSLRVGNSKRVTATNNLVSILRPLSTIAIQSIPLRIDTTTVLSGSRQNITFFGSTASQVITIPLATGSGTMLTIRNVATVSVTLSFAGSTFYGDATFILQPNESLDLLDDESTKWIV